MIYRTQWRCKAYNPIKYGYNDVLSHIFCLILSVKPILAIIKDLITKKRSIFFHRKTQLCEEKDLQKQCNYRVVEIGIYDCIRMYLPISSKISFLPFLKPLELLSSDFLQKFLQKNFSADSLY